MFPGDAILEVNGERLKYAPLEMVVEAITRVSSSSSLVPHAEKSMNVNYCQTTLFASWAQDYHDCMVLQADVLLDTYT